MIQSNQKTSLLVPYQLPKFISEDPNYENFTLFLKAYYEWLEQSGNVQDVAKSLLEYMDVDTTTEQFLQYYVNDFMAYFPQEILADKTKAIKIAKQLYQNKGNPASFEFLFRVLYNSDVDFFYTKDAVFKVSAGNWYVPRSLKLDTNDPNFLVINNLRLLGQTSKSIATVENATYDGKKTEVFISNIERLFQSGEYVTVVDNSNQPVWFLDDQIVPAGTYGAETLSAIIVGQISQILIDPKNRGLNYQVNDPVVVYGGLNPNVAFPIGATAEIGSVESGGVTRITVETEGYGYSNSNPILYPGQANTTISFSNLVGPSPTSVVATPIAIVGSTDPTGFQEASFIPVDSIYYKQNYYIGNIASSYGAVQSYSNTTQTFTTNDPYNFANTFSGGIFHANANTTLANALTFTSFATYPISSVLVENQGSGMSQAPTVSALSQYNTDFVEPVGYSATDLQNLGILSPIQIVTPGLNYANGDTLVFIGGSGQNAYGNVKVNSAGSIVSANYVYKSGVTAPLGGMGYTTGLPIIAIANTATGTITASNTSNLVVGSANASFTTQLNVGSYLVTTSNIVVGQISSIANSNTLHLTSNACNNFTSAAFYKATAQLETTSILGTGASFTDIVYNVGAITTINITNNGEDYISAPSVSLAVQDIVVQNVNPILLPSAGQSIYQGANVNVATYTATVDSIFVVQPDINPANSVYQLRVYNYTSIPVQNTAGVIVPLKIDSIGATLNIYTGFNNTKQVNTKLTFDNRDARFGAVTPGVITYGDGHAKATSTFLNGLVIGSGQYLDTVGQPSSFSVLQNQEYNNYTYQITLSKEIEKYRDVLLNLLHPTGMQVIGRIAMASNNNLNYTTVDALANGLPINDYYNTGPLATIVGGTAANPSNNIIAFTNLIGGSLNTAFTANQSTINFTYGPRPTDVIGGLVTKVTQNNITIQSNVWTYFANVAVAASPTGNNEQFYISSLTGSYNIVNNGNYSNPYSPLIDVIRANDVITIAGASQTVMSVAPVVFEQTTLAVGTITAHSNSNTVIGSSTAFTQQLAVGTYLVTSGYEYLGTIAEIVDDQTLYLLSDSSQSVTSSDFFVNVGTLSNTYYGIVTLSGALANGANGLVSVSRTMTSIPGQIQIYNSVGTQYFLELTTENGNVLTDEQGNALLIG